MNKIEALKSEKDGLEIQDDLVAGKVKVVRITDPVAD